MKQLNLFDLEEDVKNEKIVETREVNNIDSNEMKDSMEKFGGLLTSETNSFHTSVQSIHTEEPYKPSQTFKVHDKVKIVLIDESVDSETHNYRKYYEPHLIGKVGEITKVIQTSKGKVTYEIEIYGEKSIFEAEELLWIG